MTMFLGDGHATLVEFSLNSNVSMCEKSITPMGFEGSGGVDQTNMCNDVVETQLPGHLYKTTPLKGTFSYDPEVIDQIKLMILKNQLITVTFSNGATAAAWGWIESFKPNECKKGDQPTAEVEVLWSNLNESGVETLPVYAAAA